VLVPSEVIRDSALAGLSHAPAHVPVSGQTVQGSREILNYLSGSVCRNAEAALGGDLNGRAAKVEANDGTSGRHRLQTHPTAGIVQAGMHENATFAYPRECSLSFELAPELDLVRDAQVGCERFQAMALGTVSEDPIFGLGQTRLSKRPKSEVESLPVQKSAHADESDRPLRRCRELFEDSSLGVVESHARRHLDASSAKPAQPIGGLLSCCPRDDTPAGR